MKDRRYYSAKIAEIEQKHENEVDWKVEIAEKVKLWVEIVNMNYHQEDFSPLEQDELTELADIELELMQSITFYCVQTEFGYKFDEIKEILTH